MPPFHGGNTSSNLVRDAKRFNDLERFSGALKGVIRQIYGMDATERHGTEAAPTPHHSPILRVCYKWYANPSGLWCKTFSSRQIDFLLLLRQRFTQARAPGIAQPLRPPKDHQALPSHVAPGFKVADAVEVAPLPKRRLDHEEECLRVPQRAELAGRCATSVGRRAGASCRQCGRGSM